MPVVTVGFRGPRGVGLPEGTEGQFVSFGPGGAPVAVPLPEGNLPAGTEGQLVGYGPGGTIIPVDAPTGGVEGPAGQDGSSITAGTGAPASGVGRVGDLYIDTATGDLYANL